jgi:YVTN family beta-propeller protein
MVSFPAFVGATFTVALFAHYYLLKAISKYYFCSLIASLIIMMSTKTTIKAFLPLIALSFFAQCTEPSKPTIEEWVYITNEDSEDVSVISTATNEIVASIPVGKRPRGVHVAPDGKTIYVALSGSPKCPPWMPDADCAKQTPDKAKDGIAQVDVVNKSILRILPAGSDPEQFDMSSDGKRFFIANEDVAKSTLIDVVTGKVITETAVGKEPEGVKFSPNNALCYITSEEEASIYVLKTETGEVLTKIKVGVRPRGIAFTKNGKTAFVSGESDASISVIDVAANQVTATFRLPAGSMPVGLVVSDDEKHLYVANGRGKTVSEVEISSGKTLRTIEVGKRPWGIGMTSDGKFLYTANGPSNDVSVVEIKTFTVVKTIPVGKGAWGVAIHKKPI